MQQKVYYVDTCIWLNLFKKEGNSKRGIPYWKIAEEFIRSVILSSDKKIIYSGIVLRELEIHLEPATYKEKRMLFQEGYECIKIEVIQEDRVKARKLEAQYGFTISFYDIMHMCIADRIGAIVVTRDNRFIELCKEKNVPVAKPEELIGY